LTHLEGTGVESVDHAVGVDVRGLDLESAPDPNASRFLGRGAPAQ
jgi:hypothetical protein